MFQKKEKMKKAPKPSKVEEPEEVEESEEIEEADEEDEEPMATLPKESKKKEVSTELTEDMVRRALENLVYRVSRIEHHLRLDY